MLRRQAKRQIDSDSIEAYPGDDSDFEIKNTKNKLKKNSEE